MPGLSAILWMAAALASPADAVTVKVPLGKQASSAPAETAGPLAHVAQVIASSTLVEKGRSPDRYLPARAVDGKLETCWCEAVAGPGVGEWLEVDFDRPVELSTVRIYPGCGASPRIYENNNRIAKLTVVAGGRSEVELPDERRFHSLALPNSGKVAAVRFIVEAVHKGKKYDDTCIGEVQIDFKESP